MESYKDQAINSIDNCLTKNEQYLNDDDIDSYASLMDLTDSLNPDDPKAKQLHRLIYYLCSNYVLDTVDIRYIRNLIELDLSNTEFECAGNIIHTFHKYVKPSLNSCSFKIDPQAMKDLKFIILDTKFTNNLKSEKEFLQRLGHKLKDICIQVKVGIIPSDIPNRIDQDFIETTIQNSNKRLFDSLIDSVRIRSISKKDESDIKRFMVGYINSNPPNLINILKLLISKLNQLSERRVELPHDFPILVDTLLINLDTNQYDSQINEFFDELNQLIDYERIPRHLSSAREVRQGFKDFNLIDNEIERDMSGNTRRIRTIKKIEAVPRGIRPKLTGGYDVPVLFQDELRSGSNVGLGGKVYKAKHGGDRLLVRTRSGEDLSWTGHFHPFVVDEYDGEDEYFECGMGCNNNRRVGTNEKIRDSCIVQQERRLVSGQSNQVLQESINRCSNIIESQLNPRRRSRQTEEGRRDRKRRRKFGKRSRKKQLT